jgi:hypothetical protein
MTAVEKPRRSFCIQPHRNRLDHGQFSLTQEAGDNTIPDHLFTSPFKSFRTFLTISISVLTKIRLWQKMELQREIHLSPSPKENLKHFACVEGAVSCK